MGLLWIKGKPGSGKSIILKEAFERVKVGRVILASFFFNARGSELERSPDGLFRTVLHQIIRQDNQSATKFKNQFLKNRFQRGQQPGTLVLEEMQDFFASLFVRPLSVSRRVILFIDALGECNENFVRSLVYYFRTLTGNAYTAGAELDICLSSRHYPTISIPSCPEIVMEAGNNEDITRYVTTKLRSCLAHETEAVAAIGKTIIERSSGVFLWVILVVEMLQRDLDDGKTIKEMHQTILGVPEHLEQLFSRLLQTLRREERPKARTLVQWLLLVRVPLKLAEVYFALAFSANTPNASLEAWADHERYIDYPDQMKKMIRACSRGLVEVRGDLVQFIHESVREYFAREMGQHILDGYIAVVAQGHCTILRAIFNSIIVANPSDRSLLKPYRVVEDRGLIVPREHRFLRFAPGMALSLGWKNDQETSYVSSQKPAVVECSEWLGIYALSRLLYHAEMAEACGLHVHRLVQLSTEIMQMLRRMESCVWGDVRDRHLLSLCQKAQAICLESSQQETFEINGHFQTGNLTLTSPLLAYLRKVWQWNHSLHVGNLELAKDELQQTIAKLINSGTPVNQTDTEGNTALYLAAERGLVSIIELLLRSGADVESRDYRKRTALHLAAQCGREPMVAHLVLHGANVSSLDDERNSPLHLAVDGVRTNQYDIVRRLIQAGASPNTQNIFGRTALHVALEYGSQIEVIFFLVNENTSISLLLT